MKKVFYIALCVAGLCSCGAAQAPLDDAYYWPDKRQQAAQEYVVQPAVTVVETTASEPTPAYQIINDQDTTVTIRFNK